MAENYYKINIPCRLNIQELKKLEKMCPPKQSITKYVTELVKNHIDKGCVKRCSSCGIMWSGDGDLCHGCFIQTTIGHNFKEHVNGTECPVCGGFMAYTGFGRVCSDCGHKPY